MEVRFAMASSVDYLEYVLDVLEDVPGITVRKMMGEYLLYSGGVLFGGIYDDRFLVKDTPASAAVLASTEIPYEGASPMRLVDIEDKRAVADLVAEMLPQLSGQKKRGK